MVQFICTCNWINKELVREIECILIFVLFALIIWPSHTDAQEKRPFWTEKSSFVEGEWLFVVGMASNALTPEEGRQKAFENGKRELINYAQLAEVGGLPIETQMTYEERESDGTFYISRLLRIPVEKILSLQERTLKKTKEHRIELEKRLGDLIEEEEKARLLFEIIKNRIVTLNEKVKKYSVCGITKQEFDDLVGPPTAKMYESGNYVDYIYGTTDVRFQIFDKTTAILRDISLDGSENYQSCIKLN